MRGTAETKQVTTLTLEMTPAEAREICAAVEAARNFTEAEARRKAPAVLHFTEAAARRSRSSVLLLRVATLERLIAAIGMGLGNCPPDDLKEDHETHPTDARDEPKETP
jgi:hypothetical protein